jgi:alkylhydroperoxidase family enzyme
MDVVLKFVEKVIKQRAQISDGDVKALSSAGYSNGDIVEIVAVISLNMFTNYFNISMGTEVDFPKAPPLK